MDSAIETALEYTVIGSSAHSGHYVAENILVDNPSDQTSRWSGAFPSPLSEQWILLRLEKPSVLKSVKFGKFHKNHPCSTKDFRVLAGLTEDTLTEVVSGTLKNDAVAERFYVRFTDSTGVPFSSRYVKVIPLSAHGTSYHTSIWHVALSGVSDERVVRSVAETYKKHTESTTMRYMLKFLRERGLTASYDALLAESHIKFEDDLLKTLHRAVSSGDFSGAEHVLANAASANLFSSYLRSCRPTANWKRLTGSDPDGNIPFPRGGHAMCIDNEKKLIYLHGGFDGKESLDDFWVYSITEDRWRLLNEHTGHDGGPGPRSCHRMVVDDATGDVYLLGRLSDEDAAQCARVSNRTESPGQPAAAAVPWSPDESKGPELWCYHARGEAGLWERSPNLVPNHAPSVLFDHGMVMVSDLRKIYVFGGRVVGKDDIKDSGWYIYDITEKSWEMLSYSVTPTGLSLPLCARFSHAMVYDPNLRIIFIFGGQHIDQYLTDLWTYHVDTKVPTQICSNIDTCGGVETFSRRAVIDPSLNEIYISSGLGREQNDTVIKGDAHWVYRYDPANVHAHGTWLKVAPAPTSEDIVPECPVSRCAHQVVYHPPSRTIFVHGGNMGLPNGVKEDDESAETRLDDLWSMRLERATENLVIRKATFLIRIQQFREMCEAEPVRALHFLQTEVSAVVDHSDSRESRMFQDLLADLLAFGSDDEDEITDGSGTPSEAWTALKRAPSAFEGRTKLFQSLMQFFPTEAKEPSSDLLSLVARSL